MKKLKRLRRKGIGKSVELNVTPEEMADGVKALSPDIDKAYFVSLLKRANGAKGETYWLKKPELRKLGITVADLKPAASNDPAADARVMKTLSLQQ